MVLGDAARFVPQRLEQDGPLLVPRAPQVPVIDLRDSAVVLLASLDQAGDGRAYLNADTMVVGGEHGFVGPPVGRALAGLVLVAVTVVDPDAIEGPCQPLAHHRMGQAL